MSQTKILAVAALAELYRQKLSDAGMRLYVRSLSDLTDAQVTKAVDVLARSSRFMPTPAEMIEACGMQKNTIAVEAEIAWSEVLAAVKGNTYAPMGKKTREAVKQMGTLTQLSQMPKRDFDFLRSRFIKIYSAADRQPLAIEEQGQRAEDVPRIGETLTINRRKDDERKQDAKGLSYDKRNHRSDRT